MARISASLASADPLCYGQTIQKLEGAGSLHIDIEDGNFIPNITFGLKTVQAVHRASPLPLNAHLMVTNPIDYLEPLQACGVTELCFHIESTRYPLQILNRIKSLKMKAGLAFNFSTPIEAAAPFAADADFFLVMTSEEDGRGQLFHPSSLPRIQKARALLGPEKAVWADGGIGDMQLPLVLRAGADTIVMGRAIVRSSDPLARLRQFSAVTP